MMARLFCALAVVCLFVGNPMFVSKLSAQTIRFDTNVGTFDMKLNPTGNPFLQGHVDNMLAYVMDGRYDLTVINRAATGFVLQMGGFQAPFLTLPTSFNAFPSVPTNAPVTVAADNNNNITAFDATSLSNTTGTVTLALSNRSFSVNGQSVGVPNVSSGTSSFFINLGDNEFLDPGATQFNNQVGANVPTGGFIPFAVIENMETVNLINSLPQVSLDPSGRDLGAINIPILEDNKLVFVERAFILDATNAMMASALANADLENFDPSADGGLPAAFSTPAVPEPSSVVLAGVMALLSMLKRRR